MRWRRRTGKARRGLPWGMLGAVLLLAVALPTAVDGAILTRWPQSALVFQSIIAGVYALTSLMILWEASAAGRISPPPAPEAPLPVCTAIIAAYLPNEQDILVGTVRHFLTQIRLPADRFELIVAYNTPHPLPVEGVLRRLADEDPRLRPLRVEGSRSKAENVNAGAQAARGEVIGIYDADHAPEPDCFHKAWRWLGAGWDIVQGRCAIRNFSETWVARTVAVEFDLIYCLSHSGRFGLSGMGIFGGSNGYWRRAALLETLLDPAMLTEDIDSSVRALLRGCRIAHDREIVSEELAPTRVTHWFFQRKRWAQGWLEVTLKHQRAVLRSPRFTARQKLLSWYLLGWREVYPLLAMQFFPFVLAAHWAHVPVHWFAKPWFLFLSLLNLGSGPLVLALAARRASTLGRRGHRAWYWVYALFGLAYSAVKTAISLTAQLGHCLRDREWVTTPRTAGAESAASPEPS